MKPVFLFIDFQNDFLRSPSLEPAAGCVVGNAARLLNGGRISSIPIVHVWTTVYPQNDRRMPHWKADCKWICVEGTEGHRPPEQLLPLPSENVINKSFFSAFSGEILDQTLEKLKADMLVLAGIHLHACIRTTVLDAYQRGFRVWIAEDAVASDDPLHSAVTRRYLEKRGIRFVKVDVILSSFDHSICAKKGGEGSARSLPAAVIAGTIEEDKDFGSVTHVSPRDTKERLWNVPICNATQISHAAKAARAAWPHWRATSISFRIEVLERTSSLIEARSFSLSEQMAVEIGKPIRQGEAEVARTIALIRSVIQHNLEYPFTKKSASDTMVRYQPHGVISVITPWNNPLAIPLGKIAPALFFGNTVVWKPSVAASSFAFAIMEIMQSAGCPPGVVNVVCGDHSTGTTLMADPNVNAVTFTGSLSAGYSAQDFCASRRIPLQAELGGNNAAIVWDDCELEEAAAKIAQGAFEFAGQRCTANRRAVVDVRIYDRFMRHLESAVTHLVWNDPLDRSTEVGPLISMDACRRVENVVARAKEDNNLILSPHRLGADYGALTQKGAYYSPTIICCDNAHHEIVQEETFGPVLVVQKATDWNHAMFLCNGVRQGLVAALFSHAREIQERFLDQAQAGILKINSATANANAEAPFGGWKASGIGPPEHGIGDLEFYTRTQSVYNHP